MKLEIQKILLENGLEKTKQILSDLNLVFSEQISPITGKKYLHIDYSIKSPKNKNIVKECRGIALYFDTWDVARYGFYRFMNLGENGEDILDPSQHISFEEKADGSIIILWYDKDEGWVAGTRGRIFNDAKMSNGQSFSNYFWEIFGDSKEILDKNLYYIYELCSEKNRIVVFYHKPHIVLLGARNKESLIEIKDEELDEISKVQKVRRPKKYNFKNIQEAVSASKKIGPTEEGYVVKQWNDLTGKYNRLKIKGELYKDFHMISSCRSLVNIIKITLNSEELYFKYFPEYLQTYNLLKNFFDKLAEKAELTWEENKKILEDKNLTTKEKRKIFAQSVLKTNFSNYCFNRADGKISSFKEECKNIINCKSKIKKYIEIYEIDKIVDSSWKINVEEEM